MRHNILAHCRTELLQYNYDYFLNFYRKTPLLITGVDHFSNADYIKLNIFSPAFKSLFNRELNKDFKIDSIYVRFILAQLKVACI